MSELRTLIAGCGECGAKLQIRTRLTQKMVACPRCNSAVELPAEDQLPSQGATQISEDQPHFDSSEHHGEQATHAPSCGAERGTTRRYRLWIGAGLGVGLLILLVGLGSWLVNRPRTTYDGVWTGENSPKESDLLYLRLKKNETKEPHVQSLQIEKNEFPCAGTITIWDPKTTLECHVVWHQKAGGLVATAKGGDIEFAQVKLSGKRLSGRVKGRLAVLLFGQELRFSGFTKS